jgi:hypothetical protein
VRRLIAMAVGATVLVAGCGDDDEAPSDLEAAQARVADAEEAVADAQGTLDDAISTFCEDSEDYVGAVDHYGQAFNQAEATVGDITAALQATLTLAGYWTGPVDGEWTAELTDALEDFQTALGVSPTGAVDAATLSALEETIAAAGTLRPRPRRRPPPRRPDSRRSDQFYRAASPMTTECGLTHSVWCHLTVRGGPAGGSSCGTSGQ